METHIQRAADFSQPLTIGSAGASVIFWGLHVNEICAIVSTIAAVCGLMLQIYVAWKRSRAAK